MAINANANGIPFLKRYGIPPAIKNSMVLWYDLKRQGATNESMAENPILKDLSGNGHDATCYNFAWNGMSGVGGYVYDYSTFKTYQERATLEVNSTSIRVLSVISTSAFVETRVSSLPVGTTIQQHKIKVTGLDAIDIPNTTLRVRLGLNISDNDVVIAKDGVYDIPLHTIDDEFNYSISINRRLEECNVLIELLPLYPHALVSDGVDDYCYTDGLPILTDYTVIAKRSYQGFDNSAVNSSLATKRDLQSGENGAFQFERNLRIAFSFGYANTIDVNLDTAIVVQTTNSYNGHKINIGDLADTNYLSFFNLRINHYDKKLKAALYSFLLFNRDLTEQEIEWVKKNLIEGGTEI